MKIILISFFFFLFYKANAQSRDSMTLDEFNQIRLAEIGASAKFWDSIPWYNYVGKDVIFLINYLDNYISEAKLQNDAVAWFAMSPPISGNVGYSFMLSNSYSLTIKLNKTNFMNNDVGNLPDKLTITDFELFKKETINEIMIIGPQNINYCRFTPHGIYSR